MKMRSLYLLTLGIFLLLCHSALAGEPGLHGEVMLDYATFSADEGNSHSESSHFAQRLGLTYQQQGGLMGGRLGHYQTLLGGEAVRLQTTADPDGEDNTLQTSKIYYNFDVKVAPAGLPFRLHFFARDMKKTTFLTRQVRPLSGRNLRTEERLLNADTFDNLSNGTSQTFGGTLLLGIRNGSYLGKYREMLSTMPRLMIDYKQTVNRDLKSLTPSHTRDRDLAFISLNKKDNWLHYRLYDYTDFFSPENSFERKQVILGVIDPMLNRKWINLTNWIQLSTDISYTRETKRFFRDEADQNALVHRYDLNLFTNMTLPQLNILNRTVYTRQRLGQRISERLTVPLYGYYEENIDSAWRFSWESEINEESDPSINETFIDTSRNYARLNLDTRRTKDYLLSVGAEIEQQKSLVADTNAVEFTLELGKNSNRRRRAATGNDCRLRLESRWLGGETSSGAENDWFEQAVKVSYEQPVTQRWTLGLNTITLYGTGSSGAVSGDRIGITSGETLDGQSADKDPTLRNELILTAKHILSRNTTNNVQGAFSWLKIGDLRQQSQLLRQHLSYRGRTLDGSFSNMLQRGDFRTGTSNTVTQNLSAGATGPAAWLLTHGSSLNYRPTRAFAAKVSFDLMVTEYEGGARSQNCQFFQSAKYSRWVTNGVIRKLFDVTQSFSWEWLNYTEDNQVQSLGLQFDYFPTSHFNLGINTQHQRVITAGLDDVDRITGSAWAGMHYSKFRLDVNYSYGLRPKTDDNEERTESRFQVQVTKVI